MIGNNFWSTNEFYRSQNVNQVAYYQVKFSLTYQQLEVFFLMCYNTLIASFNTKVQDKENRFWSPVLALLFSSTCKSFLCIQSYIRSRHCLRRDTDWCLTNMWRFLEGKLFRSNLGVKDEDFSVSLWFNIKCYHLFLFL